MAKTKSKLVEGVIENGEVTVPAGSFATDNTKVRITMYVDADVLLGFKKEAGGRGYQTLMNEKLREAFEAGFEKSALSKGDQDSLVEEAVHRAFTLYFAKKRSPVRGRVEAHQPIPSYRQGGGSRKTTTMMTRSRKGR